MNERIEDLISQCTDYCTEYFDKEKFAELIVRECGVALSPMLRDMISRGQAYDTIKNHFGIDQ
jgi:hypothetical protein